MKLKRLSIAIHQTTGGYQDSLRDDEAQMDKMARHFNQFFRGAYNDAKEDLKKGR